MAGKLTLSNAARSHEEELRDRLRLAARRDGGDPSSFLELLVTATSERIWERFDPPRSFLEFVETPTPDGLGLGRTDALRLISFKHHHEDEDPERAKDLDAMRRFVRDELTPELAAPKGGRPKGNHSNGTVSKPGNSETYILRRLKRDRPDLAELVLDGKVTARAAGIAAGFIKPNISVPLDPERLAPILRKKLDPAALDRLRELLG